MKSVVKIQKIFRGYSTRVRRLPNIMYKIRHILRSESFKFSDQTADGRINSSLDENGISEKLVGYFGSRIIKKTKCRMWYDIKVYDAIYGWLPVNIKTTSMNTSDNTGNLAMCVHAYTNENLDLDKSYSNGPMSKLLYEKLLNKEYNINFKKDYYFIVLNKNNHRDVVINSVKGISCITPNSNNLPYQICWNKNREYNYEHISIKIDKMISSIKRSPPSWKEEFIRNIREL